MRWPSEFDVLFERVPFFSGALFYTHAHHMGSVCGRTRM